MLKDNQINIVVHRKSRAVESTIRNPLTDDIGELIRQT